MDKLHRQHHCHLALEIILNDVKSITYDGRKIRKFAQSVSSTLFADIIQCVDKRVITRFSLYTLLTLCNKNRDTSRTLTSFLDEHNLYALNDEQELTRICFDIIKENPKQKDRYKTICKKYHGRIHDDLINDTFKRILDNQ
jgi:Asp-tRNA(Asn)/Glu-tRNA(Gln) amidotransferase B subunit